jgi:uncharacterized protein
VPKFWDSSALVPLIVEQQHSPGARDLYRADSGLIVWQYTHTEIVSALTKLTRQEELDENDRDEALGRLDGLAARWEVVQSLDQAALNEDRERARELMLMYPLQSGDALQLTAALAYFDRPAGRGFVVVDRLLARAAAAEGFDVIQPARRKGGRRRRR